jgi:hypothetical protein
MKKTNKSKGSKSKILSKAKANLSNGGYKNVLKQTGLDLVAGIAGGYAGAAIGRSSLVVGIATAFVGNALGIPMISTAGVGMMSGGVMSSSKGVNGLNGLDGMKERMQSYTAGLKHNTYLDKLMRKKTAAAAAGTGTNGIGYLGASSGDDFERQYQQVMGLLDEGNAYGAATPYAQIAGLNYADGSESIGELSELNL